MFRDTFGEIGLRVSTTVKVLIADDNAPMRHALRALLGSAEGIEVIGEAGDGPAVVGAAVAKRPDVVVMDMQMPGQSGVDATRQTRAAAPQTRILILSAHEDPYYVRQAIDAGATGYVAKVAAFEELVPAILKVAAGEIFLSARLAHAMDEPGT